MLELALRSGGGRWLQTRSVGAGDEGRRAGVQVLSSVYRGEGAPARR